MFGKKAKREVFMNTTLYVKKLKLFKLKLLIFKF